MADRAFDRALRDLSHNDDPAVTAAADAVLRVTPEG
jgi:hypothetical protein